MALALRRDTWGRNSRDPYGNRAYCYKRLLAQQREVLSGRWSRGRYYNPRRNGFGRGGLGILQAPWLRRPTYNGAYSRGYGGYGGYGGYYRQPPLPLPRQFGRRTSQYSNPYPQYSRWSPGNYRSGVGNFRQQYQPRYRGYSPPRQRRRSYRTSPYYEDDNSSDDDYEDSDVEESYYPSASRSGWSRDYSDWDDDEWDEDEDEYENYDEEDDSDFDDEFYDTDVYDFERYDHRGNRFGR